MSAAWNRVCTLTNVPRRPTPDLRMPDAALDGSIGLTRSEVGR